MKTNTDATDLQSRLDAANSQITAITTERDTLAGQVKLLTTDRDVARNDLVSARMEISKLTDSQKNFDSKLSVALAREISKHGIRQQAVAGEDTTKGATALTLTEQCRLEGPTPRGVKPTE